MTNRKISELTKTEVVLEADVLPVVTDSGTITKKVEANDLIKQGLQQSGVKDLILSLLDNDLESFGFNISPIGTISAWHKSFANTPSLPSNWVECNGQTLSDVDSPYNGQVIPNLNGDNRFLRGNSASGTTGGSASVTHNHTWTANTSTARAGSTGTWAVMRTDLSIQNNTSTNEPQYMNVVWIMRIK